LRATDVVWSSDVKKRGAISGRMIHTDVKSLRESDFNDPERENLARIRIFAWLRRVDEINFDTSFFDVSENILPEGFYESLENNYGLPTRLVQTGKK
jgi:hypothetical protein